MNQVHGIERVAYAASVLGHLEGHTEGGGGCVIAARVETTAVAVRCCACGAAFVVTQVRFDGFGKLVGLVVFGSAVLAS